ncbi:MAG: LysR family transcriptional regulator [Bdellovibrionales bacterium]
MKPILKAKRLTKNELVNPITKELEYFLACAEAGSILRASEKLGIQQAGLSKVIQKLEQDTEHKLFYRRSRGIELTEYGKGLRKALINTKSYWSDSYSEELRKELGLSGNLRFGFHPSVAASVYPQFIEQVVLQYPSLKIETEFDSSLEITRKVADLQIDVGVVVNPVKNQELVFRRLKSEFVAAWGAGGPYENVLLFNPAMIKSGNLLKKYKDYRLLPTADYEVIANVAKGTRFLGLLPSPIAERYGLKQVGEKIMTVDLSLVWHKDRFRNSAKFVIIDLILSTVK